MISRTLITFLVTSGITGAASFALLAVLSRSLTASEYGRLGLVISCALAVNALFFQWVRLYFLRAFPVARGESEQGSVLAISFTALVWSVALAVSVVAVLHLCRGVLPIINSVPPMIVLGIGLAQAVYELALSYLRSIDDVRGFSLLSIFRAACYLTFGIGAAYVAGTFSAVGWALAGSYLVASIVFLWRGNVYPLTGAGASSAGIMTAARYGLPLSLATALLASVPALARWFVDSQGGAVDLAALVFSWDISTLVVSTLGMSSNFVFYNQILVRYEAGDRLGLRGVLGKHVWLLSGLIFLSWLVALLIGAPAVHLIAGEQVANGASKYIPLSMLTAALMAFRQYWFDHAFMLQRKTGALATLNALGLVLIPLIMWLLPLGDLVERVYFAVCGSQFAVLLLGILVERKFFLGVMHVLRPLVLILLMTLIAIGWP